MERSTTSRESDGEPVRETDGEADRESSLFGLLERQNEELAVADEELRVQAEELEHAIASAHAERRRHREIFQVAFDAMFVTDRAGVITDANAAAARLLATEPRFLHGRSLAKLVDEPDVRRVSDLAAQARSQTALTTQMTRPDGALVGVVLACVPVEDGARVLWSALPAPRGDDVERPVAARLAALERANRDSEDIVIHERAMRKRLEEENRMLRRFFSVVAGDLAGPVNAVLSWSSTLRAHFNARESRVRALEAIESSARQQLSILERLLDLPRVMADDLRLDVSVVDLAPLARSVAARFANAAAHGGIVLRAEDRSEGNAFVFGDARRLEQILEQLLENALRFTPGGGTIDVILARVGEHVVLEVADSGRGLDSAQLRAFAGRIPAGTGHYLVRRLTEVHGGTVHARSDGPGKGTTVVVKLPARGYEPSEPLPRAPVDALEGARVLLVEDDVDAREVVAAVLGHRGATVATARDGQEALALVRSFEPHVIVSTVGSSELDGYTLVRRLRHEAPGASAIALGVASRAEALRGAGYAFDVQLPRPIDPTRLVEAVRELLVQS